MYRKPKVQCITHQLLPEIEAPKEDARIESCKKSPLSKTRHRKKLLPHANLESVSESSSSSDSVEAHAVTEQLVQNDCEVSSSEIDRSSLLSVKYVLRKYEHLIRMGKVASLAGKLAEEAVIGKAVIGKAVLKKCTLSGYTGFPALPVDSLNTIKQTLLSAFPQFLDHPDEFKVLWMSSRKQIGRLCSKLRSEDKMTQEMLNNSESTNMAVVNSCNANSTVSFRRQMKHLKKTCKLSQAIKTETYPFSKKLKTKRLRGRKNIYTPAISSYEIDRSTLLSVKCVLHKYKHYIRNGQVAALAVKLAEEAVIGKAVLKKCTLLGYTGFPALPVDSLNTIKQTLLSVFPWFQDYPDNFEKVWTLCRMRIGGFCSTLRKEDKVAQELEIEPKSSLDQLIPLPPFQ